MTASRSQWWCPACGERVRHNHACRKANGAPFVPVPSDFRARVDAARAAYATQERPAPEVDAPALFDPEADQ